MKSRLFTSLILLACAGSCWADWNQWRGPNRDGKAPNAELPDSWADDFTPAKLWESEEIPSDHYGGHGSVSIAEGKVYAAIVWHRDEPTTTRTLTSRDMSNLGYRGNDFSEELMAKVEETRMNVNPRLRGKMLDDWSKKWTGEHLNEQQLLKYEGWVVSRFKQGKTAIPWADLELMNSIVNNEFENHNAFLKWVEEQEWKDEASAGKLIEQMPNTKMAANDVIVCVSLETGETLWKFEVPGNPTGRSSSSTPAVADGIVYGMLSGVLYAVDADNGEELWNFEMEKRRAVSSSPMVADGKVFIQLGQLTALDGKTGEVVWASDAVRTNVSSPAVWKDFVICNDNKELVGVDIDTGEEKWRQPAGGQGTPAVSGDHVAVISNNVGLKLFRLSIEGAQEVWTKEFTTRRYNETPIIHDGHVYHLGGARHTCVDLESGDTKWEVERSSNISSPILADGKFLVLENNGGFLAMVDATPQDHQLLGRTKIGAMS
ncbi:MAG: PQQ-binding-like beta-propeller repeat protein, partial [Verrucomicrobiota bacterium]